ncbi:hypothetical protein LUW74_35295 [Actinomadura madurae]|uniref:hypothetical protein n=1 Tax=Actinomadura madurae TaxID=1993 RepID=UPI002026671A|nr:hypothetical protein [Actinomadura madurae]URN08115.1 hypothetical protein LUW74_35295 [Actinomadura madurae]
MMRAMSGDGKSRAVRRPRRIAQPRLPPGPLQDLKNLLYRLYVEAGAPSLDDIHHQAELAGTEAVAGWPGRDTIHRIIGDTGLPPSQGDTMAIAKVLARLARWDVSDAVGRVRELWVQAQMAVPVGMPIDTLDPFALEVRRAISAAADSGPLPVLPRYITRTHDARLTQAVAEASEGRSAIAVLVGSSSTGKTRACWEGIQALPRSWRLWHPIDPTRAEAVLAGMDRVGQQTVVWLNEAQEYLAHPTLGERVASGLRELLRARDRAPILLLATLPREQWARISTRPEEGIDRFAQARELLVGHQIHIPDSFTAEDLTVLQNVGEEDPRLAEAAAHSVDGLVTQYLAGVPVLLDRYQSATPVDRALIHAAYDARRLDCGSDVPLPVLADAAFGYLTDLELNELSDDWLEKALARLTLRSHGVPGPLSRVRPRRGIPSGGPFYRLADPLWEHLDRGGQPIPGDFWDAVLAHELPAATLRLLAEQATVRCQFKQAALLLGSAAQQAPREDRAEIYALLGEFLAYRGLRVLASQYSEASARIGSVNGMVTLSLAAEDRGDIDEALHWAKRASAAGNDRAFFHVYWLLANHERFDEAEAWIRPLADQGDITAIRFLAAQLAETGQITEAEELLWPAARDNLRRCRRDLIDLLYKAGRRDRISALFGQLADSGDDDAQEWLSAVARWDEDRTERETDRPGDRPDPQEMAGHGSTYVFGQRFPALDRAAELEAAGDLDAAIDILSAALPVQHWPLLQKLSALLEGRGRSEEAVAVWRFMAETGNPAALREVDHILRRCGRAIQAEDLLRSRIISGRTYAFTPSLSDPHILEILTAHLEAEGRADEAASVRMWGLDPSGATARPWAYPAPTTHDG